jgi:hypothetical protein
LKYQVAKRSDSEQADAEPRREGVQRGAADDYRHEHALLLGGQAGADHAADGGQDRVALPLLVLAVPDRTQHRRHPRHRMPDAAVGGRSPASTKYGDKEGNPHSQ